MNYEKNMRNWYLTWRESDKHLFYQSLKDACEDLFVRQFSYQSLSEKGNVINHKSRWVSEVAYVDNEAVVRLIFSPVIVPLITRLEEQFTKYEMQQISNYPQSSNESSC